MYVEIHKFDVLISVLFDVHIGVLFDVHIGVLFDVSRVLLPGRNVRADVGRLVCCHVLSVHLLLSGVHHHRMDLR
jgi:hypothetical protein